MKRLKGTFGINSEHFWRLSRGLDTREVVPDRIAKSVSHETTFSADIDDDEMLEAWLLELTEQVGRRLRRHGIYGKTIQLKLRYSNFETITRSRTICPASQSTEPLWQTARELLKTSRQMDRRSVRLLGMGVSNLSRNKKIQQSLFDQEETEKANRVDDAADLIRKKFGNASVKRGSSLAHGVQYRTDPRVEDES